VHTLKKLKKRFLRVLADRKMNQVFLLHDDKPHIREAIATME
jgi:hypothetical protein